MNALGFGFGISGKIFISSLFLVCIFILFYVWLEWVFIAVCGRFIVVSSLVADQEL